MSASVEKMFLQLGQEALRALLAGKEGDLHRRTTLFKELHRKGEGERRQARVLASLERAGVVVSVRPDLGPNKSGFKKAFMWGLTDPEQARSLVRNPINLSRVLWPQFGDEIVTSAPTEVVAVATPPQPPSDPLFLILKSIQRMGETMEAITRHLESLATRLSAIEQHLTKPPAP